MAKTPLTLDRVNGFDQHQFVESLGSLFEGSPWIAEEAWHERPFADITGLHSALCRVMYDAPTERKLSLIRAHPDLVGKAALAGTLTPESAREQASAGLDNLTQEEVATFTLLNNAYHDRFGFPFVICARENKRESILAGFDARLRNSREEEIQTALDEIAKIARLRLSDAVLTPPDIL
ncbi:MAG TPA: 2-oxo-4-hydroxy-4-carboxy-5-ureidoimidazoline decarboxylase [Chloroflexia bacterium]|nr:2-oxo-4-hydroxy-4-carboxy-5-ureidoimidazoline decarboxylase [Chloroflexia bacterium]